MTGEWSDTTNRKVGQLKVFDIGCCQSNDNWSPATKPQLSDWLIGRLAYLILPLDGVCAVQSLLTICTVACCVSNE